MAANPALAAAAETGRPVIPLFVLDEAAVPAQGGASKWWLHHSLAMLSQALSACGAKLVLRRGAAEQILRNLIQETGAIAVYWNRQFEPQAIKRDTRLEAELGIEVRSFNGSLLHEPTRLKPASSSSFKVFTPFFRALNQSLDLQREADAPRTLDSSRQAIASDPLASWGLTPRKPDWAQGFAAHWTPGEAGALAALDRFLVHALDGYAIRRDLPAIAATSRLSPHLHFGEISPAQVWRATTDADASGRVSAQDALKFKSEIAWREFSHHLLVHQPDLPDANLRREFDAFPWRDDDDAFDAWTKGQTGIPIVDAGMRELWATGWMHNRVRMIAASFLVKNLMIDWRRGAAWFWDTLVDADLANNSASWQWVAGSGADAAPYFRVFNPILQGRKFDPDGDYVRKWVPELARVDSGNLHAPWEASMAALDAAGVILGRTYPMPVVDLAFSRARALDAFASLKSAA